MARKMGWESGRPLALQVRAGGVGTRQARSVEWKIGEASAPPQLALRYALPVTIRYTYDPLYRLTQADYRSAPLTAGSTGELFEYAYDQVGNRTTTTQSQVEWGEQVVTETAAFNVAASGDDADEQCDDMWCYQNWTFSSVEVGISDGVTTSTGLRFNPVTLPPDAHLLSATLRLTCSSSENISTTFQVYGEASANPAAYSGGWAILERSLTSFSVTWPVGSWATDQAYDVEVTGIIQELMDNWWSNGKPMALQIRPAGQGNRAAYSFDGDGSPAQLRLTFTRTAVVSHTLSQTATSYVYDAANRLTSANGQTYTWDNNGNLLNDGSKSYTYNAANRLIAVSGQQSAVSFAYNGDGARVRQIINGEAITYSLDLAAPLVTVLAEKQTTGNQTYLYGLGDSPLASYDGAWRYLSGRDGLNSVRQETDAAGNVIATRSFDPYGVPLGEDGGSPFGYTGEMRDEATGLVFLRARYYDPATGRFFQQDPLRLEQNLYAYVASNPINRIDPSGLFSLRAIAKSYGYSNPDDMDGFLDYFASIRTGVGGVRESWSRWGWLALLLTAKEYDIAHVGHPVTYPPYLDFESFQVYCNRGEEKIGIGQFTDLGLFHDQVLGMGIGLSVARELGWRNTKPTHYWLNDLSWQYLDEGRPKDLPDFRVASVDVAPLLELAIPPHIWGVVGKFVTGGPVAFVDRFGRLYGGFFIGGQYSYLGYISAGEGYVDRYWPPDIRELKIPDRTEVSDAITGPCLNVQGQTLVGVGGSVCVNGATSSFVFFGIGGGIAGYGSWLFDLHKNIPEWNWDYVDYISGFTRQDVENMIENEIPQCEKCCGDE